VLSCERKLRVQGIQWGFGGMNIEIFSWWMSEK